MASLYERNYKNGNKTYWLREKTNGKVKLTYLGTKPPIAKSRGWIKLSPEIVAWLKDRAQQREKQIVKMPPEQKGKYRTIVVDPPWPMERINRMVAGSDKGGEKPFDYRTITISQIKNDRKRLPVRRLMNKTSCLVFLWTTQKHLPISYEILDAWGLNYLFTMVWDKGHGMKPFNLPLFNCEFVVVGRLGKCDFVETKNFKTLFIGGRRNHSQKPREFYTLLKRITPAPRIDMFSREKHKGFDQYGNETDKY